jgi:hypothetical protein
MLPRAFIVWAVIMLAEVVHGEHKDGPHPVIAEALPRLRKKEGRQPPRVSRYARGINRSFYG